MAVVIRRRQIQTPIPIQVRDRHTHRPRTGVQSLPGLETPVPLPEIDPQRARRIVGRHQVQLAITIQIARYHPIRLSPRRIHSHRCERSIPLSQQDAQCLRHRRDRQVRNPVDVEVFAQQRQGHPARGNRLEIPGASTAGPQQDSHLRQSLFSHRQIQHPIPIEIPRRYIPWSVPDRDACRWCE